MKSSSGSAGVNRSDKMTPTTTRDSPDTPSTTSMTKSNKYGYREVTHWHELAKADIKIGQPSKMTGAKTTPARGTLTPVCPKTKQNLPKRK